MTDLPVDVLCHLFRQIADLSPRFLLNSLSLVSRNWCRAARKLLSSQSSSYPSSLSSFCWTGLERCNSVCLPLCVGNSKHLFAVFAVQRPVSFDCSSEGSEAARIIREAVNGTEGVWTGDEEERVRLMKLTRFAQSFEAAALWLQKAKESGVFPASMNDADLQFDAESIEDLKRVPDWQVPLRSKGGPTTTTAITTELSKLVAAAILCQEPAFQTPVNKLKDVPFWHEWLCERLAELDASEPGEAVCYIGGEFWSPLRNFSHNGKRFGVGDLIPFFSASTYVRNGCVLVTRHAMLFIFSGCDEPDPIYE